MPAAAALLALVAATAPSLPGPGEGPRTDLRLDLPRAGIVPRLGLFDGRPPVSNAVVLADEDGSFEATDWSDSAAASQALSSLLETYYSSLGPDVQFVVVHTSFPLRNTSAFYAPIANDVSGIGQQHLLGDELYDLLGPAYELEGAIVLNDVHAYDPQDVTGELWIRFVFGQELAHRFCTFVHARGVGDALLGRDLAHWSYFVNVGDVASPMEGNAWRDNGDGTFTTQPAPLATTFSGADLYLMGLVPPEDVRPLFLIENPDTLGQLDDYGGPIGRGSPPSLLAPVTIGGTRRDVTIEDVIAEEGPRIPGVVAPREHTLGFVIVVRPGDDDEALRALVERVIEREKTAYEEMARQLVYLSVRTGAHTNGGLGAPCPAGTSNCSSFAPACLRLEGAPDPACSRACAGDAACADLGYCCRPTSDGGSGCFPCPTPCDGVTCAGGEVCRAGACVPYDPCDGVFCRPRSHCADGTCVPDPPVEPCQAVVCPSGQVCEGGRCLPLDPCAGVTCPAGTSCADGNCVSPCAGVTCGVGERCVDGACVAIPDPCDGVRCGEGERCVDGACAGEVPGEQPAAGPPPANDAPTDGAPAASGCGCASAQAPVPWILPGLVLALRRRRVPSARLQPGSSV